MANGRKNQSVLAADAGNKEHFRETYAHGVVTLAAHLYYETAWALAANESSDPNAAPPNSGRVVQCEAKGLTVVGLTPYWPGTSATVTGVIWLYQSDEPDTAKKWRPVVAVTFTPGSVLRQLFNTGGHDMAFQPTGGVDSGHLLEIHVDAA